VFDEGALELKSVVAVDEFVTIGGEIVPLFGAKEINEAI
jgi:hypothetical protein